MRIRNNIKLSFVLLIGDIIAINVAFLASYWVRFNSGIMKVYFGTPHYAEYIKILPLLTLILLFLFRAEKLYSMRSRLSIVDEFFLIVRAATLGLFIFMAFTFVYREYSFSRGVLLVDWFMLLFFTGAWRFFANRVRFVSRKRRGKNRRLLIIGNNDMVARLIKHISFDPHWDYKVEGIITTGDIRGEMIEGVPVIGDIDKFADISGSTEFDEVILTELDLPRDTIIKIMLECEKNMIEFRLVADLLGMMTSQVDLRTIDGIPLLGLKESPLIEWHNRIMKRVMDIVISFIAMIALIPVFLIVAVLVKLNSPGPVFYLQKRIGEDGSRFTIIKFRTMINNAEKGVGRIWAKEGDSRRTKIGSFLRKTNLDELPQLYNVFKGEMSLVGPRPERPHFVGKFKESIPRYMSRHKIRSGMTGWAQVNGLRGNTSIEERTKYDLYYVENWSIAFDLKIMCMSVFALKNAY
jgi:exopolysaccharide biosynthesis polyprenyl glycosylphosphotransferase